jgi:hypothetical protein
MTIEQLYKQVIEHNFLEEPLLQKHLSDDFKHDYFLIHVKNFSGCFSNTKNVTIFTINPSPKKDYSHVLLCSRNR